MALGNLAAFGGLASGPDKNERVQRELGTLQQLSNMVEKERQEELMFQEMEANQIEEIQKQAEGMLERDRQKISSKAIQLGSNIKDEIGRYGSRRAFFANGGYAKLREYKNNILNSEEANRYKDNKINLERILKIQEAGKGAFLAKQDLEALKRYENGEDVAITYSGMKSEVDIPEDAFQFGDNIPPGEILRHGNNYAAIYGNWLLENPHLEGLSGEDLNINLLAYTQANYSGKGKDKTLLQAKIAENKAKAERNAAKGLNDDGTPKKQDYATELFNSTQNYMKNVIPNGSNLLAKANDDGTGEYLNYYDTLRAEGGGSIEWLLGGSTNNYTDVFSETATGGGFWDISRKWNKAGKDIGRRLGLNDYYQLASAVKIAPGANEKLAKGLLKESMNEDGTVRVQLNADGSFVKTNGEKLTKSEVDGQDKADSIMDGNYKVGTAVLAWADADGNLLTNVTDKNGKINGEEQKNRHKKWNDREDNKAIQVIAIPLTDESGRVVYKTYEFNNVMSQNAINEAMGPLSDVSSVNKQVEYNQEQIERVAQFSEAEQKQAKSEYNKAYTQQGLASPYIMEEQKMFQGGSGNRNNMIQAYYMAANHLQNGSFKAESFIASGLSNSTQFTKNISMFPKLQESLLNYGLNDESAIDEIVKVLSAETDDPNDTRYKKYKDQPDYEYNLRLGEMMKSYLRMLTGKK